jgi:hypothetical protein
MRENRIHQTHSAVEAAINNRTSGAVMSQTQIESLVLPRLDRIRRYSEWMKSDADGIAHNVRTLPCRPEYATLAEHELTEAKRRIEDALVQVNTSLADFAAKPAGVRTEFQTKVEA